jgi:hypothetical protein
MIERCDQPGLDGIGADRKHNRDLSGGVLGGSRRRFAAAGCDHRDVHVDEFGRERR